MKAFVASLFLLLTFHLAHGQAQTTDENTQSLLTWIIKKEHIGLLFYKTDLSALNSLRGGDALTVHSLENEFGNQISERKCLMDFMTVDEASIFHSKITSLKEIKWKKTPYVMDVKYFRETSFHKTSDSTLEKFSALTIPIFVNKEKTRALIGVSWAADPVIAQTDLLLCEFDDGEWHIVARVGLFSS